MGNASIIPYKKNVYLCSFREFSYSLTDAGYKTKFGFASKYGSYFELLNKDFKHSYRKFKSIDIVNENEHNIRLDDGRLSIWNDEMYFSTTRIIDKKHFNYTVFKITDSNWTISLLPVFASSQEMGFNQVEKNWMPIPDKPFKMIYEINPISGCRIVDLTDGTIQNI